jgi:hypothetical protein
MGERKMLDGKASSLVERYGEDQLTLALLCDESVIAGIVMSPDSARELARILVEFAKEIEGEALAVAGH